MSSSIDRKQSKNIAKIKKDNALEVENQFIEKLFENFLYIAGPARSGTSIFWRSIDINSNYFPVRRKMRKFENWGKKTNIDYIVENMFRIDFDMLYERIESDYVDDLKSRVRTACNSRDFREILACKAASDFVVNPDTKDAGNYTYWSMKSNDCDGLKLCKDALKKSKFVFFIRNPHSTILSQTIRMGKGKGLKDNNRFLLDIVRASMYWCRFSRSIIYFLQNYPEDTILIRYEDFIENPEFETYRVFNFTDSMEIDKNEYRSKLEQLTGSATNNPDEKYKSISRIPLNRWSTEMKSHEVAIVALFTRRICRQFGYQFANTKYELTAPIL